MFHKIWTQPFNLIRFITYYLQ